MTVRSTAFISILISIAVVGVIIGIKVIPATVLPTLRSIPSGLPVKITGYIFGPFVGLSVGIASDLIAFFFIPSSYSYFYTISLGVTGLIPGIVTIIYNRWIYIRFSKEGALAYYQKKLDKQKLKNNRHLIAFYEKKIKSISRNILDNTFLLNIIFGLSITLLIILLISMAVGINSIPESTFQETGKIIKSKTIFIAFLTSGLFTMCIFVVVIRFWKPKLFLDVIPIIIFSAFLEPISNIILSLADIQSGILPTFEAGIIAHSLFAPVQIWLNLTVIYFTYKAVSPIIFKTRYDSYS